MKRTFENPYCTTRVTIGLFDHFAALLCGPLCLLAHGVWNWAAIWLVLIAAAVMIPIGPIGLVLIVLFHVSFTVAVGAILEAHYRRAGWAPVKVARK